MNVAYLVNQYPHTTHTFIRREIAALEAMGVPVVRFSIRPAPRELADDADRAEVGRTTVLLIPGALVWSLMRAVFTRPRRCMRACGVAWRLWRRSSRGLAAHLAYLAEAAHLFWQLRRRRVTHLHAHFGTNPAAVALLCRTLGGPPFSFTVHGPEEFDQPVALSLRRKIRGASFVAAISSFGRSQLFRWADPADWDKIHVVRCGLELDDNPVVAPPVAPRFVCVGRLGEQKGQLLLVEAAARLRERIPDLEIRLVGDGPMREAIQQAVVDLAVDANVRLLGWKSNAEVADEILSARALVLPSFAEGLPVVIMESLALGRPVISTYVAGIPELVRPGANGWLVPAGNLDALVEALHDAATTDLSQLCRLGSEGVEAVRRQHDVRREAARLAELFADAAKV